MNVSESLEDFVKSITMGRTKKINVTKSPRKRSQKKQLAPPPSPPAPPSQNFESNSDDKEHYSYKSFIVFVDDPKLKSPFKILHGTHIRCLETKAFVNNRYLSNKRRKRSYDIAYSTLYTFPCRIFAKAERENSPLKLNKICERLNEQFKVLMACKVDVETAYERLLEANPRKVKNGVQFETGLVEDSNMSKPLPDTASSYTEADESKSANEDSNTSDCDDNKSIDSDMDEVSTHLRN